ncbi:hypothetical protein [Vulcaniibacterium tengchongense]|nr:hypothetical protein [Vulcaniibacterium tengchongense]
MNRSAPDAPIVGARTERSSGRQDAREPPDPPADATGRGAYAAAEAAIARDGSRAEGHRVGTCARVVAASRAAAQTGRSGQRAAEARAALDRPPTGSCAHCAAAHGRPHARDRVPVRGRALGAAITACAHLLLAWWLAPLPRSGVPPADTAIRTEFLPRRLHLRRRCPRAGRRCEGAAVRAAGGNARHADAHDTSSAHDACRACGRLAGAGTAVGAAADTAGSRRSVGPARAAARTLRMREPLSPQRLAEAIGRAFALPGHEADPCPANRARIAAPSLAGGDAAALAREVDFERRRCRP